MAAAADDEVDAEARRVCSPSASTIASCSASVRCSMSCSASRTGWRSSTGRRRTAPRNDKHGSLDGHRVRARLRQGRGEGRRRVCCRGRRQTDAPIATRIDDPAALARAAARGASPQGWCTAIQSPFTGELLYPPAAALAHPKRNIKECLRGGAREYQELDLDDDRAAR